MLTPEYLDRLPDNLVKLFQGVEDDLLRDIARRIAGSGRITDTAEYQLWILEETQLVRQDAVKELAKISGLAEKELRRMMEEAGTENLESDDEIYRAAGLSPPPFQQSPALLNLLNAGFLQTAGTFSNLTATTANTVSGQFEDTLDRAWLQIASGALDYNTAIRRAVKSLAATGILAITYPSGHHDTIEVAVRRAALTGVSQTAAKLSLARMDEMGCDLVETTAHPGARPTHQPWQGKVFSRSGQSREYPDFVSSTGYGTGAGLCGWNCRHFFFPYFEGISVPAYSREKLAAYEQQTVSYHGETIPYYDATQRQRAMERQVRRWKREYIAMEAAGQDTAQAALKLREWREKLADFTGETGLYRQNEREQIPGFGRSEAAKARWDFTRQLLPNYQKAVIPDAKIKGYVLNPRHPVGQHKALVFEKALGYNEENADELIANIYENLSKYPAKSRPQTQYGQPFEVRMTLTGPNGKRAQVKTGWIIDKDSDIPRLTSAYVDEE